MNKRILFFIIYLLPFFIIAQESIIKKGDILYLSNTVVVKFKEDYYPQEIQQKINSKLKKKVVHEVEPIFSKFENVLKKGQDQFSRIYKLKLEDGNDPFIISNKISKLKEIEWAEPKFIREVTYYPNDSIFFAGTQINLSQINAIKAWDITKGDSNIVIGIIDTGVDWQHPDINANIYRDKNGNIVGYDFGGLDGTPDDDPSEDKPPIIINIGYHGTHVAGIASAVSDNLIGIASIGYNCSIMPVKVSRNDKRNSQGEPYIYYGFEGIKYAAEHGARVINCSWGGYGYSRYEQEIIDYAISKGALIVASAGNENKKSPFYPASYNGVLSVGWLDNDGQKRAYYENSSGSNYGYTVDVFAPGTSIISTWPTISGQKYKQISGSSMSAPHVAGLAGLIFSRFPELNPLQVAERIRMTCDDIYDYNPDSLKFLLGKGRINAFKAVKDTSLISIRAVNTKFIDKGNENGLLENGEQVFINVTFQNFLDISSNISVELICSDPYIQIVNKNFTINQLNTLETITNTNNDFSFKVLDGAPYNHTVNFMLKYSGNNYSDFQWFSVRINPTYDTHVANKVSMTITSKGTLGFNDYPDNQEGVGFKYKGGDNLMFEGAFMYGISDTTVMDAARETYTQREDFRIIDQFKIIKMNGDEIGTTRFDDYNFGEGRLGIETTLKSYSFSQPPYDNFIILVMNLKNTTSKNINGLYAGFFFDWDIPAEDATKDSVNYDETDNFGYAYCVDKSLNLPFAGVALISSDKFGFYPIYNEVTLFDIDRGGFTKKDKWISLSSGIIKGGAGIADVSFTISGGPFNIPAGETLPVAFALAAGENLNELRTAIRLSREKYKSIISDVEEKITLPKNLVLYQNYPNPFNPSTIITYELPEENYVVLKVYDLLGREIATLVNEQKQPGRYNIEFNGANLTSGIYIYALRAGNNLIIKKMTLIK
ncbi:S8 family serine peptidase [Rosettibacter firmus]|uniref:S8 family serine peptidase n=1 Tax=Rosettibacter firmus TaxID=3111522 RepID=UPI00336C060C